MTTTSPPDRDLQAYITDTLQGFMEALEILESDLPAEFYARVIVASVMDTDSLRLTVGTMAKQLNSLTTHIKGVGLLKCHYLICALRLTIKDRQTADEAFQRLANEIYAIVEMIRRDSPELDSELQWETIKH